MRIESISDEQLPILARKAEEWTNIGLATGPADVDKVREGVAMAYTVCKLSPPSYYVWLKSPRAGAIAKHVVEEIFDTVYNIQQGKNQSLPGDDTAVYNTQAPWYVVMNEVWSQLVPQGRKIDGDTFPDPSVAFPIFARRIHKIMTTTGMQREFNSLYGAHDAAWLSFYDTLRDLGIPDIVAPMDGMMLVAKNAGWWWPLTDCVIVTDRPMMLNRDSEGRMHSDTQAAIAYGDGWSIWASHGVMVPQQVIEAPHTLTVEQIVAEPNAQVKSVMLERYGMETFMKNANAKQIDASDFGKLITADIGETDPLVMVQVTCPSTDHDYLLRVPPHMKRAREAVAWTFDMEENEYNPSIQT